MQNDEQRDAPLVHHSSFLLLHSFLTRSSRSRPNSRSNSPPSSRRPVPRGRCFPIVAIPRSRPVSSPPPAPPEIRPTAARRPHGGRQFHQPLAFARLTSGRRTRAV